MADKDEVNVRITGQSTSLVDAMNRASATVRTNVEQMKGHLSGISGAFTKFNSVLLGVGAVIAGGALFRSAIEETRRFTFEAIQLGKALGVTATQAAELGVAIDDVGGTTEDLTSASQGLTRQLKTNESGLNLMGIKTREADGSLRNMRDILLDAIAAVNSYKEGTDRNLAAQVAFGRGANATSAVFKMTKEGADQSRDSAKELGLVVGQQSVADFEAYRVAMDDAGDVMQGLSKVIGEALMPALTQVAEWFRSIGPGAITVVKGAIGGVIGFVWALITGFRVLYDLMKNLSRMIWDTFTGLGNSLGHALTGDFKGAAADLSGIWDNYGDNFSDTMAEIVADAQKGHDKIVNLFKDQVPVEATAGAGGKDFKIQSKNTAPDLRFKEWTESLEKTKEAEGAFRKADIAADITFWQQKLQLVAGSTAKDKELRAKIGHEIYQLQQRAIAEQLQLEEQAVEARREIALQDIDAEADRLQTMLELGEISKAQELQGQLELEDARYQFEQQALKERLKLVEADKLARAKVLDELELLERKHANATQRIEQQATINSRRNWMSFFSGIQSGFANVINGFIMGTRNFTQTISGLFMSVLSVVSQVLAQMAAEWIVNQLRTLIVGKATAASQIAANAGIAATAAMGSVAAIPVYGWAMAPGVGAATFGTAMGYQASISAAGGYDIPAGVNPVGQLHAQEMVLPAEHAETIRGMRGRGGGTTIHNHINAFDVRSVTQALSRHNDAVGAAMRQYARGRGFNPR